VPPTYRTALVPSSPPRIGGTTGIVCDFVSVEKRVNATNNRFVLFMWVE
jgi:hypothetical protein